MPKIRDLVTFEKIREVVDIDLIESATAVEKYVISSTMEGHLVQLLDNLQLPQHKATQIIGGYGSGKSHLLAFLISILTQPTLRSNIQNLKVKKKAEALNREFAVIHWELQPNDVSLIEYFYDQLELQLAEKYSVQIQIQTMGAIDHKKNIQYIIEQVKKDNPIRGLVVVIDEISDFLKQKTKEKIMQDVQFLRVLGQIAQSADFIFVGAMQEHVFTNPKYIEEADSIGRVAERFQIITINREDIKQVIAQRVLAKTPHQRLELEALFTDYTKHYPHLQANLDEYIDLFPLHPYVIQIFSELPYFEKRGVIQFTIQEVDKILDAEFPRLVAYERIFDEIDARHTIKNLDSVSPIVTAVQTLDSKVDLLEPRFQSMARQIIKALAVLRLYGKTTNNGATIPELANTLLAIPTNKNMEPVDEIHMVLTKFRKVTDGQFLNVSSDGYYFLDMTITVDYDQVILRKTESLPDGSLDEEILLILKDQLGLSDRSLDWGCYPDTCKWPSRRSYREGTFIYESSNAKVQSMTHDYQLVFVSPFCSHSKYSSTSRCVLITSTLPASVVEHLKKVVAARLLMEENYQRSIMQTKHSTLRKTFVPLMVRAYMDNGMVLRGSEKKSIKNLITREFQNFAELLDGIKPDLFEEGFTELYPSHPKFSQNISRDNSKGEFSSAIKDLVSKGSSQSLFSNAKALLNAMGFLNSNGQFDTQGSEAAEYILTKAKEAKGTNVDINSIFSHFSKNPYGYDRWMTAFAIVLLTYNGEIALKPKGGGTVTSSEVVDVFGKGLEAIENIVYFLQESDFNPQPVIELMQVIGISPAKAAKLRFLAKRGEAVQDFQTRVIDLRNDHETVHNRFQALNMYYGSVIDVEGLKLKLDSIEDIPLADFEKVKTPNDFKKVVYDNGTIGQIGVAVDTLKSLFRFFELFTQSMEHEIEYLQRVNKMLQDYPNLFEATEAKILMEESFGVLSDADRLMDQQELQPLIGKLQQARKKFIAAYYHAHEDYVGNKVAWSRLLDLAQSQMFTNLRLLKHVSILNTYRQVKLENEIAALGTMRCTSLSADFLEKNPQCPSCQFPSNYSGRSIDQQINAMWSEVEAIYEEWQVVIVTELKNYKDNLEYLKHDEQSLLTHIIESQKLPPTVTEAFVIALNNLFSELVVIEVSAGDLLTELFGGTEVLDYITFEQHLQSWKQKLVAGQDVGKIRFKQRGNGLSS